MKEKLMEKEQDVLFDLAYGRFDYNDETADIYEELYNRGLATSLNLKKIKNTDNNQPVICKYDLDSIKKSAYEFYTPYYEVDMIDYCIRQLDDLIHNSIDYYGLEVTEDDFCDELDVLLLSKNYS